MIAPVVGILSHASRDSVTARDSRDSWDTWLSGFADLEIARKDRPPARAAQHVFAIWQQNRSGLHESWGRP